MNDERPQFTIGQCATLACLLEVNAPKVGNVHRAADFDDATLNDFAASAVAVGPILQQASQLPLGEIVLRCVEATRQVAATNTNLGTILLLTPLAAVPRDMTLDEGIPQVLDALTSDDADKVYRAIRLAQPGGLGNAEEMDVHSAPPESLLDAMRASASRDAVAGEYGNAFALTLQRVAPGLVAAQAQEISLPNAIVFMQLQLLAEFGDSLIARKCGENLNEQCRARAQRVLKAGSPHEENYHKALADFDFWLRSDGRQRNPGTTADLIAAGLFVCLRDGLIGPPFG